MKPIFRVALVMALAFGMSALGASPGGAAPIGSCAHLTATAAFNPGLTNTPKNNTITAKGTLTSCTPAASTGGSGTLTSTIKVALGSCGKLSAGGQKLTGTGATTWKNKKVSKYSLSFTTGKGGSITLATITGKVSSGLFVGHKVSGQVKFTLLGAPDCSAKKPIKNITVKNTKPFVIS
jgi:hypothetical protein